MDREKVIKELESLRDICNAKSNMAVGNGKVAWAGYANAAEDALALLKEQPEIVRCKECKHYKNNRCFFTMRRHGLHDDWYCADAERNGGDGERR